MSSSEYKVPGMYVDIINDQLKTDYSIKDFTTIKHEGGRSNDVFTIDNRYVLKVFFDATLYSTEKTAIAKLMNCSFLVDDYTFVDDCNIMYCQYVQGETMTDYIMAHGKIPPNFLEAYFGIQLKMLEYGVWDKDYKLDSLLWLPDGTVKKFDFDNVDIYITNSDFSIQHTTQLLTEQYKKLLHKDLKAWQSFIEKPCFMAIKRSLFDDFISNL